MTRVSGLIGAALVAGLLVLATGASAQSSSTSASSRMWGSSIGGTSAADSSVMHNQDGVSAGQVNAARRGFLFSGGPGLSITAIGSQSIVSTTVLGNNNSTSVNANQSSSNSGTVSNNGAIAY